MRTDLLRRAGIVLASAGLLASLAFPALGGRVVAQQLTCDGKVATITDNDGIDADPAVGRIRGTNGPDVIVGTEGDDRIQGLRGEDVICSGAGHDRIYGGSGNDRLFGGDDQDGVFGGPGSDYLVGGKGDDDLYGANPDGSEGRNNRDVLKGGGGEDDLYGGPGADRLLGNAWTDYLDGQGGNDKINGGRGHDDCTQGPGRGPVRNCELADLKVAVICPASGGPGVTTCQVRVKNKGPEKSAYFLELGLTTVAGVSSCAPLGWTGERTHFATLAPGATRSSPFSITCDGSPGSIRFSASVDTDARDPKPANGERSAVIEIG